MRNVVGQIASKEDFYFREKEITRITRSLDAGANIQLAAPRRVGKSSILYYLMNYPEKGYTNLYIQVESARSKNDYYRKIYREIIKSEVVGARKKLFEQIKDSGNAFLNRLKGVKIGTIAGIDFQEAEQIDYEDELLNLLLGIDLDGDKLILMIDEFPEVILNIVEDQKGDIIEARKFLQSNRELRNHSQLSGKVQFIYTGSNSLNLTVSNLDSPSLINDLNSVPVDPLPKEEAGELIKDVLATYKYCINDTILDYFITKVEWTIPFYFQLIIQEIISEIDPSDEITDDVIDHAFESVLQQRNDHHFEHYVKRLKRVFNDSQREFVQKFLNELATKTTLTIDEAYNIGNGILKNEETKRVLNSLNYDGYIINHSETEFKFNSPILRNWWFKHEC